MAKPKQQQQQQPKEKRKQQQRRKSSKAQQSGARTLLFGFAVFCVLFAARAAFALTSGMRDGEGLEGFEPVHRLLYKSGARVELPPSVMSGAWVPYTAYQAVRGVRYLAALPGSDLFERVATTPKLVEFYMLRLVLAFVSALADTELVVCMSQAHTVAAVLLALFLAATPAVCSAATTFTPASVAAVLVTVAFTKFAQGNMVVCAAAAVAAASTGVPMALVAVVPLVILLAARRQSLLTRVASLAVVALLSSAFAAANVWLPAHMGSSISASGSHGVEGVRELVAQLTQHKTELAQVPSVLAGLLADLNVVLPNAGFAALLMLVYMRPGSRAEDELLEGSSKDEASVWKKLARGRSAMWAAALAVLLCVVLAVKYPSVRAQLVVVYPLLCFTAALGLFAFVFVFGMCAPVLAWLLLLPNLLVFGALSASRLAAMHQNEAVPLALWRTLGADEVPALTRQTGAPATVCLPKTWPSFASSFFLPQDTAVKFLRSADEPLPAGVPDDEVVAHSAINTTCHFIVDVRVPGQADTDYPQWTYLPPEAEDEWPLPEADWVLTWSQDVVDRKHNKALLRDFEYPQALAPTVEAVVPGTRRSVPCVLMRNDALIRNTTKAKSI